MAGRAVTVYGRTCKPPAGPRSVQNWLPPRAPAPLRPAARRPVPVAQRQRRARRDRRPGREQTRVLHDEWFPCIDRRDDLVSQRIEDALGADLGSRSSSQHVKASGYTGRRYHPHPVRHMSVNHRGQPAPDPRTPATADQDPVPPTAPQSGCSRSSDSIFRLRARLPETAGSGPRIAHGILPTVFVTSRSARKSR
jgi:hypothetical protein